MSVYVETHGEGPMDLVLLHGWGFNGEVWKGALDELTGDFRLILVDMPGYGGSPIPADDYSLPVLASLIKSAVPEGAIWLGWSLGGMVAMQAVMLFPQAVAGLCLVSSSPRFVRGDGWRNALPAEALDDFSRDLDVDRGKTLLRFLSLIARGGLRERKIARSLREALFRRALPDSRVLRGGLDLLRCSDLRPWVNEIPCPVLALFGEKDALVPPETGAELLVRGLNWRIGYIANAGHAPFVSHPGQVWGALKVFAHAIR